VVMISMNSASSAITRSLRESVWCVLLKSRSSVVWYEWWWIVTLRLAGRAIKVNEVHGSNYVIHFITRLPDATSSHVKQVRHRHLLHLYIRHYWQHAMDNSPT